MQLPLTRKETPAKRVLSRGRKNATCQNRLPRTSASKSATFISTASSLRPSGRVNGSGNCRAGIRTTKPCGSGKKSAHGSYFASKTLSIWDRDECQGKGRGKAQGREIPTLRPAMMPRKTSPLTLINGRACAPCHSLSRTFSPYRSLSIVASCSTATVASKFGRHGGGERGAYGVAAEMGRSQPFIRSEGRQRPRPVVLPAGRFVLSARLGLQSPSHWELRSPRATLDRGP